MRGILVLSTLTVVSAVGDLEFRDKVIISIIGPLVTGPLTESFKRGATSKRDPMPTDDTPEVAMGMVSHSSLQGLRFL